ncbi:UNVERIFIED_CONTAM: hypothetical protein Sangu_1199200 [Sesamum angustifolium]|uniref:Uncharacterized protein n=1 Tax=Sesamum angustifolium TaxID=2727405 RepID=A0AAW2NJE2_9LAMI
MGASESSLRALSSISSQGFQCHDESEEIDRRDNIVEKLLPAKFGFFRALVYFFTSNHTAFDQIQENNISTVNPNVLLELFSMYRDWQEEKAQKITKRQEDIENKIELADALAVKLLQRFNYSVSAMKTTSNHLSEVHALQVELGELKGRLTEVISNCDALCKRIADEGPESLRSTVRPLTAASTDQKIVSVLPSLPSTADQDQLPQQES